MRLPMPFSLRTSLLAGAVLALTACGQNAGDDIAAPIPRTPIERCVSFEGALPIEPAAAAYAVKRSDFQRIASAGFDTVRLPLPLAAHTGAEAPFDIDPEALDQLDTVMEWALSSNLGVILTLDGFSELGQDVSGQSGRMNRIWVQLAQRYRSLSPRIFFELLDGPSSEELTAERLNELNSVILRQIRNVDQRRWVILPASDGSSLKGLTGAKPPSDPRVMLTFQYFDPTGFTGPIPETIDGEPPARREWGKTEEFRAMLGDFETATRVREATRRPVLLGEFGVHEDVSDVMRARWIRAVRQTAESNEMGWCHWNFAGDHKLHDLETGRWTPEVIDALFRDGDKLN